MRDRVDRNQIPTVSFIGKAHQQAATNMSARRSQKRLGDYLVEAGLLSQAQIDVALNDQQTTSMKFGEILAARGWVKQQTIEFVMTKVIMPERRTLEQRRQAAMQAARPAPASEPARPVEAARSSQNGQAFVRRDAPIAKPLPSVKSSDGDVNWVG